VSLKINELQSQVPLVAPGNLVRRLTVNLAKSILRDMQFRSRGRLGLVIFLVLLFVGLSFNAYACLLPLFGTTSVSMGNGCSTPDEAPVRQFCDAFKTLTVQSGVELYGSHDFQIICSEDSASVSQLIVLASPANRLSDHSADGPSQDLLLKISVLRI
jgi:hypothetical protein